MAVIRLLRLAAVGSSYVKTYEHATKKPRVDILASKKLIGPSTIKTLTEKSCKT